MKRKPKAADNRIKRKLAGMMAAVTVLASLCACSQPVEEIPVLLEPVEISLSGREVVRGDICDKEAYNARVKSVSQSYAFGEECRVEELCVKLGEYVEEGQVLAVMKDETEEKEQEMLSAEVNWLKKQDDYLTRVDEADYEMARLAYDLKMGSERKPSGEALEKEQEKLTGLREEMLYEGQLRRVAIEEKEALLSVEGKAAAQSGLVAKESGYVTYVKQFSSDNSGWQVEAGEIVVMTSAHDELYVAAEVVEAKAKQASEIYVEIEGERFQLAYQPYNDKQKTLANKEEITLEARFLLKDEQVISGLYGKSGVLYLVSNRAEDVLSVSPDSLFQENGEYFVYLIKDGQKIKQPVIPGIFTENAVEIKEGLKEGDRVYYAASDMPATGAESIMLESMDFEMIQKYDQVKIEYTSSVNVLTKPENAVLEDIMVENGMLVKTGDVIAIISVEGGISSQLEYQLACQKLQNEYEYEKKIKEKEAERFKEKLDEMKIAELTETYEYKVTVQESIKLALQMELAEVQYEYEKSRYLLELEEEKALSGRIEIKAQCDGRITEVTSHAEGETLEAGTRLCRIQDTDSALVMVYAENALLPAGGEVTIDIYQSENDLKGTVVYCCQDAVRAVYGEENVLKADTPQTLSVSYIEPEEGTDYSVLKSYGINVSSWQVKDAIVIPPEALFTEQDRKFVWLKKEGQPVKQYVTVGYHDVDKVLIVQGLAEGDEIYLSN